MIAYLLNNNARRARRMDAVGPAGLYLSKQQNPPRLLGEQGAADFAVTRVMFLIFSIPKPEANAKTGSNPGTVLKSRGRCLSVNL